MEATNASMLMSMPTDQLTWPPRPISLAVIVVMISLMITYIVRIVQFRLGFSKKISPGYNLWFGSVAAIANMYKTSPADTHPHGTLTLLSRKYNPGPLYFLDYWPFFGVPQMIVSDPELAAQLTQTKNLPKHPILTEVVQHLTGKTGMLLLDGDEWKRIRALFNPGFAAGHLMTLIGGIVDDTLIFRNILAKHAASGDIFPLEEAAALLTLDVMGKVVLQHNLNAQTTENELVAAFRGAIHWTPSPLLSSPFSRINPVRIYNSRHYEQRVNKYIGKVVDERFASMKTSAGAKKKPAIDLAYDEYVRQSEFSGTAKGSKDDFKTIAIDQMKTFIFAGHDTSSSTTAFVYYILSLHPDILEKVRQEHDVVFGTDVSAAPELLKEEPNLINQIPYTLAVIKETLRLFPVASSARAGHPDIPVTYKGETYPTEGYLVIINQHTMSRDPNLFPDPDAFIPERFLTPPHNYQNIMKDSYRPFEKGPRNCIGQELAILEMKIFLVLTIREFDFKDEYEENDRRLGRENPGDIMDGRRGMFGYRAYQVLVASSKPVDGMPMTVKKRAV